MLENWGKVESKFFAGRSFFATDVVNGLQFACKCGGHVFEDFVVAPCMVPMYSCEGICADMFAGCCLGGPRSEWHDVVLGG